MLLFFIFLAIIMASHTQMPHLSSTFVAACNPFSAIDDQIFFVNYCLKSMCLPYDAVCGMEGAIP